MSSVVATAARSCRTIPLSSEWLCKITKPLVKHDGVDSRHHASDRLAVALARQKPAWKPRMRQAYYRLTLGYFESELLRQVNP